MIMQNRFAIGEQYSIGGCEYKCVQLVEYGRHLIGVQKAYLVRDTVEFVAIRWPDGEVNRITKRPK